MNTMKLPQRQKPVGWRNDSYRHYLAAKGIQTNRFQPNRNPRVLAEQSVDKFFNLGQNFIPQAAHAPNDEYFLNRATRHGMNVPNKAKELGEKSTERFFAKKIDQNNQNKQSRSQIQQQLQPNVQQQRPFFSEKKKGLLDMPHEDDMVANIREQDINKMQTDVVNDLSEAVEKGELTAKNREEFMREVFANEAKLYKEGVIDKEEFDNTIHRKMKGYLSTYSRKAHIFDTMDGSSALPGKIANQEQKIGVFDWDKTNNQQPKQPNQQQSLQFFAQKENNNNPQQSTNKTKKPKRYYAYNPTYTSGDLAPIAVDGAGTAGAAAVSWIPLIVPLALAYGGASYVKNRKERRKKEGKGFFVQKEQFQTEELLIPNNIQQLKHTPLNTLKVGEKYA